MMNAPYEKEFVFNNGERAKNLLELSVIIGRISQQDFELFVNPSKNDFANWIEYVLLDTQLAASLRSTTSLDKTRELLNDKLAILNNSTSSINNLGNKYKKTLFNIFRHEPKQTLVEVKTPIEKLPEPKHQPESENHFGYEHHIIQKIPEQKILEQNVPEKATPDKNADKKNNPKKDSALKKWYEFKKKERESRKHKNKESNKDSKENLGEDSSSGNIFWILLYGALIVLIIALIVYKFVLRL